ncbi:MAG: cytochrome c biogenesis protein CcsA [Pirellulaceae bacterium]|nr:cytochrome c biogenesis protein CcsA [Pirellulaceae bacterium]
MSNEKTNQPTASASRRATSSAGRSFFHKLLLALGSLKITVFLLSLALVVVLIATLQQSRRDIYSVKQQHFRSPVVFIEFQEMLTPAWFPNFQEVGGGFLMPSGALILSLMLVNLFCAHATRFRIQARGKRLLVGSLFLIAGVVTTLLVVMNGNSRGEFQDEPLIAWSTQWNLLQGLLGAAALAGLAGTYFLESSVRRTFSFITGLVLGGLLAFLLFQGPSAFIGNDAMRVVWRLVQGSVAAIVLYIGALMVFRRKAGIVVIHAGLLLLMIGELYTTYSAVEQRLFFYEGDTTQHTVNVNAVEVAFLGESNEEQRQDVITVPSSRLGIDGIVDVEGSPFRLQTEEYYTNARLFNVKPEDPAVPGAKGLARFISAQPIPEIAGVDGSEINSSAAYVRVLDRNDNDLGTYLISQQLYDNEDFELDTIEADGETWQIALRFRHIYKPYSVKLNTTSRVNYTGTDIPQAYSSSFRITDPDNNVNAIKEVSMNNPLRYNNETFYQSGHDTNPVTGKKYSVLQVVRNTGWMIPYVSCAMVGIGLLLHFLGTFVGFVEKLATNREPVTGYDKYSMIFVAGFLILFGMYAYRTVPKAVIEQEFNLERFGEIPVAFAGRVQPIDSIARTTLRQLRKYEIPVKWDWQAQKEVKHPPVRWLTDWIFGAEGSDQYRIFKIDDPEIVQGLELERRKSHLYSMQDLLAVEKELREYLADARAVNSQDASQLSAFQKKIIELNDHLDLVRNLQYAFSSPIVYETDDPFQTLERILLTAKAPNFIPRVVPGTEENDWSVLSPLLAPEWIQSLCDLYGTNDADKIATKILDANAAEKLNEIILRRELGRTLMSNRGLDPRSISPEQIDRVIDALLSDESEEVREKVEQLVRLTQSRIADQVAFQLGELKASILDQLSSLVPIKDGKFDFTGIPFNDLPLAKLRSAYLEGEATTFNSNVEAHLSDALTKPDVQVNAGKVGWEHTLNRVSPFYLATAIYIGAFLLSLLSWLFLTGAQNSSLMSSLATASRRSAFWLVILGFAIHTLGLVLRIYVSGRPPVTNLYGSAIFIGWVGVLFGLVTERMIGYCFGNVKAAFAGVTTLLTAFALGSEGDTFSVLQAVLDTQFWLSTHVVSITIGYAATLVAGLLGILYLIVSIFVPRDLSNTRKTMAKMVYGVTCLALLFSFVGTVLGGLWADDSWGRFWGWDPKENGALMIVLVNAILLHARWAGLVRDRGMAVIAILGNIVTLWSWFAVNELGIGLHTYGLTEGRMKTLCDAWLAQGAIILLAAIPTKYWLGNRAAAAAKSAAQARKSSPDLKNTAD